MLELALANGRDFERLPERLVPVTPVQKVNEHAEQQPTHEDESRVGDVLKDKLREHGADEKRTDKRKDGNAVSAELDVPWHPVRTVQRRFDESQPHHRQVGGTERKSRCERVDGTHEVDLLTTRKDAG